MAIQAKADKAVADARLKFAAGGYKTVLAVDPGLALMAGGVKYTHQQPQNVQFDLDGAERQNIGISNRQVRRLNGHTEHVELLTKYTNNFEALHPIQHTRAELDYESRVNERLNLFEQKQLEYGRRKVTRLGFDAYIRRPKALHHIVKRYLVECDANGKPIDRPLILFGDGTIAANSPMKGKIDGINSFTTYHSNR